MTKPEWGTKRTSQSCGKRFYDLNRTPIICPQCGTGLEMKKVSAKPAKAEVAKSAAKVAVPAVAAKGADGDEAWVDDEILEEEAGDEDLDIDEDEDDSEAEKALLEDSSDLDEDDVAEVKEHLNSPADE